ncbi:MAG: hypothetical protein IPL35_09825 [Sphingobacteriales bacterium]|nr:hypothetical protein [Sphingobacteriales bacterium]
MANIYARGGKKLSGNAFEAKGNLLMSGSVGIMLSGLGMYENLIECNDFENTFIGISAEGNNSGLNIAENDFTCSEADVYV